MTKPDRSCANKSGQIHLLTTRHDYRRTTVTARHAKLPATSNALKVMMLLPSLSGMLLAIQVMVPVAVPAVPEEFIHVTTFTPTLSVAMPWKLMVLAVVAIMLAAGYVMRSDGGVKSPGVPGGFGEPGGLGGGANCWRVTERL